MTMRLGEIRAVHPDARLAYTWVPYERISVDLKRAMIAAEDAKFVEHEGFDWDGIQQALDRNARRGRIVAGGSTITQQLAKNLFLSSQRSYLRKIEEAMITLMLEGLLDKRRILELYLNVIGGDGPQPSLLREAPGRPWAGAQDPDHTRAHALGGVAVVPIVGHD